MMNSLRAKEYLELQKEMFKSTMAPEMSLAMNEAISALEKQMPKKVKAYAGEPSHVKAFDGVDKVLTFLCYPCPGCGKWIHANENKKYCPHCGQALDWSDGDEK